MVSTAALFFCGGGLDGAKKVLATGVAGILLAALTVLAITKVGGGLPVTAIAIGIFAFVLVVMSALPGLSATSASFLGGCVFFCRRRKARRGHFILMVVGFGIGAGLPRGSVGQAVRGCDRSLSSSPLTRPALTIAPRRCSRGICDPGDLCRGDGRLRQRHAGRCLSRRRSGGADDGDGGSLAEGRSHRRAPQELHCGASVSGVGHHGL